MGYPLFGTYDYSTDGAVILQGSYEEELIHRLGSRASAVSDRGYLTPGILGGRRIRYDVYLKDQTALRNFLAGHRAKTAELWLDSSRGIKAEVEEITISEFGANARKCRISYFCPDPYWYGPIQSWEVWSNELAYSCDYSQSVWNQGRVTVTPGQAWALCGSDHSCQVVPTTENGAHYISQVISVSDNAIVAIGVLARQAGYRYIRPFIYRKDNTYLGATCNLETGAISAVSSGAVVTIRRVVYGGDTYYWCGVAGSIGSGAYAPQVGCNIADNSGNFIFAGDGTSGVYLGSFTARFQTWGNLSVIHTDSTARRSSSPSAGTAYIVTSSTCDVLPRIQVVSTSSGGVTFMSDSGGVMATSHASSGTWEYNSETEYATDYTNITRGWFLGLSQMGSLSISSISGSYYWIRFLWRERWL